jgi:hypothetical protein
MRTFFIIVALSSLFVGCGSKQRWPPSEATRKKIQSDYDAALADATNSIRYAADFARLFPGLRTGFSYYTGVVGPPTLRMEIYLFDRYELSMQIPVTFDEDRRKVRSFGQPEFVLQEISEVKKIHKVGSLGPVETLLVGRNGDRSLRFGAGEWKKVVEARGDFSIIGFTLVTNSPAPGFENLRKNWERQMKKQP